MVERRSLTGALSRFGLAGLANTAAGGSLILMLDLVVHVPPHAANAIGYVFGIGCGFVLNRTFVFRNRQSFRSTGPRFLLAAGLAFVVNQVVLTLILRLAGATDGLRLLAQIAGMAAYSLTLFTLCRTWVFRSRYSC